MDVSPGRASLSAEEKTITVIDPSLVLVFLFSCLRKKGADRLGGGKQRHSSCLNPIWESLLSTLLCKRRIWHKDSNKAIIMSAFNLHGHQCCHDYRYYPLHHHHQRRLQLVLKYHQSTTFIFCADLPVLCSALNSLKTFLLNSWTLYLYIQILLLI